jgi:hypothetical protein
MKSIFLVIIASLLILGCKKPDSDDKPAAPDKAETTNDASGKISLDLETQKRIGLVVESVKGIQIAPELKCYGKVVDPSSLVSMAGDLIAAKAMSDASQAELKRLQSLAAQDNASARAVQTAEATAAHDMAQLSATRLKILSDWGTAIANRTNLTELAESLAALNSAVVRAEVPINERLDAKPATARVVTLNDESVEAENLGPATSTDPLIQSRSYLFIVRSNSIALTPGQAVTVYLAKDSSERDGCVVPRSAVIRQGGEPWVYLQTGDTNFFRQHITLDTPLENGWFVAGDLKTNDQIVVTGAQILFSDEMNQNNPARGGD